MTSRIEQAAKLIYEKSGDSEAWRWERATDLTRGRWTQVAQALADAGLLATREELGIETFDELHTIDNRDLWEKVAAGEHPESKALRRYVTEWKEDQWEHPL